MTTTAGVPAAPAVEIIASDEERVAVEVAAGVPFSAPASRTKYVTPFSRAMPAPASLKSTESMVFK